MYYAEIREFDLKLSEKSEIIRESGNELAGNPDYIPKR